MRDGVLPLLIIKRLLNTRVDPRLLSYFEFDNTIFRHSSLVSLRHVSALATTAFNSRAQ